MTETIDAADGGATPGGRVGNVDVLRAVAALMVLAGHAYFLSGRAATVVAERWYDVLVLAGASGVWLFFAISGYVIGKPFVDRLVSDRQLPRLGPYALRRVVRIYPLYWVVLTGYLLVAGTAGTHGWQFPLHYLLLHNLVPGREQALLSVAWTLSIEVLFYATIPALAVAVRRARGRVTAEWLAAAVLASWAASIAYTVAASMLGSGGQDTIWARLLFPAMWQMFCPGLLVALAPHLTAPTWRRWLVDFPATRAALVLAALLLLAAAVLAPLAPRRYGVETFTLVIDAMRVPFAVGFGLVLAFAVRARPVRASVPLHLGMVSYGLYLIHPVVMTAVERVGTPLPREGILPYAVHLGLVLGFTVPLALISWRWFEEPLVRWARAVGRRQGI